MSEAGPRIARRDADGKIPRSLAEPPAQSCRVRPGYALRSSDSESNQMRLEADQDFQ